MSYDSEYSKLWRAQNPDYNKKWKEKNPEKVKEYAQDFKKRRPKYQTRRAWAELGVSVMDFEKQKEKQDGKCAGCLVLLDDKNQRLDHCHKTRVFRGVLCNGCNVSLGTLNDSPETLRRLAEYLEKYK